MTNLFAVRAACFVLPLCETVAKISIFSRAANISQLTFSFISLYMFYLFHFYLTTDYFYISLMMVKIDNFNFFINPF